MGDSRDYMRLFLMMLGYFCCRGRQLEQPASGAAAAKGKSKGKGKRNSGDCVQRTTKGQCSRRDKCGMKHDPEMTRESKGKGKGEHW